MTVRDATCERARALLMRTQDFDCFDAGAELVFAARMNARDVLALADELDAERSARRAAEEERDRFRGLVAGAAYLALGVKR